MTDTSIHREINSYLVGGAVRDQLLGRNIVERDYVVVGSNVKQMLTLGFQQVGKDFPVFLHPTTKEEYALARTEKKQGQGYTGFVCHASEDVTLEQDLLRRDLTVNAMALTEDGRIIDPFNGQQDLQDKILRHVSEAFVEDPLRVLRVARFAARYHYLGFTVADETMTLMEKISTDGELSTLSAERTWKEIASSLSEKNPEVFFQILEQCSALKVIWPELVKLWQQSCDSELFHNQAEFSLATLKQAVSLSKDINIRFACLCVAIANGKNVPVPASFTDICSSLKPPKQTQQLALKAAQHHQTVLSISQQDAETILSLFDQLDSWRKPEFLTDFLLVCQAKHQSLSPAQPATFTIGDYLNKLFQHCRNVNAQPFIDQGLTGKAIKNAMQAEKLRIITNTLFSAG